MIRTLAERHSARTIVDLVTQCPDEYRHIPAIIDGPMKLHYGDMEAAIRPIVKALYALQIKPEEPVAIWAPNSYAWILAAIAVQWCGAILLPLNTRMKGRETQQILADAGCQWVLSVGEFLGQDYPAMLAQAYSEVSAETSSPSSSSKKTDLRCILLPGEHSKAASTLCWEDFIAQGESVSDALTTELSQAVTAESYSDLLFTSGTTGKPKGVLCRHGATIEAFRNYAIQLDLRIGENYLIVNPFFHAFGYKAGWVTALLAGCTILPESVFDATRILQRIHKEQIHILPGPPTLYTSIISAPDFDKYDISSLRVAVTGSASISPTLISDMRDKLNIELVLTAYGLTECGGLATMCAPSDSAAIVATTSGKPISKTELCICLDGDMTHAANVQGEICLRGYHVMAGYWNDIKATQTAIDRDGWLHTGDLGQLDDAGNLRITGRLKDMYICGGFNCYPAEIEAIIVTHPEISEVAIVGVPDERMGEVGCAFVRGPALDFDDSHFINWCRTHMANYKVPRYVQVVQSFPMNASNKILKHELQAQFLALKAQ